jgi:hypothetical protein
LIVVPRPSRGVLETKSMAWMEGRRIAGPRRSQYHHPCRSVITPIRDVETRAIHYCV